MADALTDYQLTYVTINQVALQLPIDMARQQNKAVSQVKSHPAAFLHCMTDEPTDGKTDDL